jgi:hypothetical protein
MYLAELVRNGRKRYIIRESCYHRKGGCWRSRDLFDLGRTPWDYIEYPGGNSFYISESVCDRLDDLDVVYDYNELEELFWKFIKKDIRRKVEPFHCRGRYRCRATRPPKDRRGDQVRTFDKRRIYYLRCGVVDQGRIDRLPVRYFKPLLDKSRDEIEQYVLQLEKNLSPREYKQYVYVIFDLQRYFRSSPARSIPQALDQDKLDEYFLEDLCELHGDESFWAGFARGDCLHEYLVRYAVMFFDFEFDGGSSWNEYMENLINSRRFYRPPSARTTVTMTQVVEVFGVSEEDLKNMDKAELTKLFRQKAHEHHPDKGGQHDEFVRLAEAYRELLQRKE